MFYSKLEKSGVKKILFITLSNIGDCILTLPVMDALKKNFPNAKFYVLVGPKARELFVNDPKIEKIIIYDKQKPWQDKAKLTLDLRKEKFDIIVDLRNSAFALLLKARLKTTPFLRIPRRILHMKERHLLRLKAILDFPENYNSLSIYPSLMGKDYIENLLKDEGIVSGEKLLFVGPGAANHIKQWDAAGFAKVCDKLIEEFKVKIIFVGDDKDKKIVSLIISLMKNKAVDFSGKTTLRELAFLLQKAQLLISCDSAVMHMASYLNIPVFAIFGPTNSKKYGPWSDKSSIYRLNLDCSPCEKSGCNRNHECMQQIDALDVYKAIKEFLKSEKAQSLTVEKFKKILIIRTDRIGDVILTTPVIKAIRQSFPKSFISIMVSPVSKDIVEGNPYLDEVIVYDKKGRDKGIFGLFRFVLSLKKRNFDLSLNLHTKKRINLISFLAGIKQRIGYDNNKFSFLLTTRLKDVRVQGKKHEADYCLDVLKTIGINTDEKQLFMPLKDASEKWAQEVLKENNVKANDMLVAIHPDASCPSKRWPIERFAQVCNKLIEEKGFKIAIISGQGNSKIIEIVKRYLRHPVLDLSGRTSVSQLASFLKRCNLFISNDSGPVHIAQAVGTPVIVIFGRNQAGLSPIRWAPLGKNNIILHKDVGCKVCLAHNCKIGFICLAAISVKEILEAVDVILKKSR
ncbi:MAG: glycosyltransferase family 9 protein [Candidatus Omnitrophota bacterium]|nr:glycosyltransferase family 9 protein [Candidatus Omnitrophota bacterium]